MIHLATAHLWKEWRENQAALLVLMTTAMLASVVAVEVVVRLGLPSIGLPAAITQFGLVVGVIVFGGETLSRDLGGGRDPHFLARIPCRLATPFIVRVVLFAGLVIAVGGAAAVASQFWMRLRGNPLFSYDWVMGRPYLALIGVGATWTLAASCWIRQGMLAAPAGIALVALLIFPALLVKVKGYTGFEYLRDDWSFVTGVLIATGIVAAWASFRTVHRYGRGRGRGLLAGMPILLAGAIPVYGLATYRSYEWHAIDVNVEKCTFPLRGAILASDDTTVWADVRVGPKRPIHTLRIDLATGDWELVGEGPIRWVGLTEDYAPLPHHPVGLIRHLRAEGDYVEADVLDTRTGETLWTEGGDTLGVTSRPTRYDDVIRDERRAVSKQIHGDGFSAWMVRNQIELERADGSRVEQVVPPEYDRYEMDGDLWTQRCFDKATGKPQYAFTDLRTGQVFRHSGGVLRVVASPVGMLVGNRMNSTTKRGWKIVDESAGHPVVPYLQEGDEIWATLRGELLVATRRPSPAGAASPESISLILLNLLTGEKRPVRFAGSEAPVELSQTVGRLTSRTPYGTPILELTLAQTSRFGRLDDDRLTLANTRADQFIAPFDRDHILVASSEGRLIRAHFGPADPEVLFPLPTSKERPFRSP